MMDETDDDYWNTSETKEKAFNFDDDVLSLQEILAIGQQKDTGQLGDSSYYSNVTVTTTLLPLNALVSPKVLDLILLAHSGQDPKDLKPDPSPTVGMTLKRLALGRSCSLHTHRSMKSKTALLDGAVAIGDGNVILTVVLFLIQTLNRKLVFELLSCRPSALAHYVSYLGNDGKITELTDLLTMLGRSPDAAMYQFHHHLKAQGGNIDSLVRKMGHLHDTHFTQPGGDTHQCKMLADYVKLLEWQRLTGVSDLHNASPVHCLAHCCRYHWHEGAGTMMSPLTVAQRTQMSPLQHDWVVLNVHARAGHWDVVESLNTKKDWLGRNTVSWHIPPRTLLPRLAALRAPPALLAALLAAVPDTDERLALAHKHKVHSVVIETLAKQRDRVALTNYKLTLPPHSEHYILAETTLRSTNIKWKN